MTNKYTAEFKNPKSKYWKVIESGDFEYKNVPKDILGELSDPSLFSGVEEGTKFRVLKNGKVLQQFIFTKQDFKKIK